MDHLDWVYLKTLYEHSSISKAAQSLFMSQPALTKRIQQMETDLQVTIIQRGSKGVIFTIQGEYLAKCAEEMIERYHNIKDTVYSMDQEVSGTLRLGVSNYFSKYKLPRILKLFRERHPKIEYKVITGLSDEVFNLVYNKKVHFGIVRGDHPWIEAKDFLFTETICITSKEKIEIEDLPYLPKIEYKTTSNLKRITDDWWRATFSQPPNIEMEVENTETCREMVRNGLGYGLLPSVVLKEYDDLHRINICDPNGKPIVRNTWMLYHGETLNMKLSKEFSAFIKTYDFDED